MDPDCLMAFPQTGVLDADRVRAGLAAAPPWVRLVMSVRHMARPDAGLRVIGYTASAARDDGASYRALCISVHRRTEGGWRLVQHQQTPVVDGSANGDV